MIAVLAFATAVTSTQATADGTATAAKQASCSSAETRAALISFVTAFNRGDFARLDSLFASEPAFEWYSSEAPGQRLGTKAKRRTTLIGYFRMRHANGDRLGLGSFGFNGNSRRYGNFEMTIRRKAQGYMRGAWFQQLSKGAAICDGKTVQFIVMSLGRPT